MAQKGQIFEALLSGLQFDGATLSGGKVYFYEPGTTTLKAVYVDRNKATPAANPYTLSANGQAEIFGDGVYDVKVTTSAGVQKAYWDNVALVDVTSSTVVQYADYDSLNEAVAAIGGSQAVIEIQPTDTAVLTASLVVPANIHIVSRGGVINHSTYNLTINGHFDAGLDAAFTGTGTVKFGSGSVKEVYAEWFGAAGDWDGATGTDDTAAIQKAITSFRTVRLLRKGYKVTDEILLNPTTAGGTGGWRILGTGNSNSLTLGSYLYQATASKAILKLGDVSGLVYDQQSYIADIGFTGVSTAIGIWLAITEDTVIERCKFTTMAKGIQFAINANTYVIKPRIYNSRFQSLDYGIFTTGTRTGDVWIKNNTFLNNRTADISIAGEADGGYLIDNFFGQDDTTVTPNSQWVYLQKPTWYNIEGNHFYNSAKSGVTLATPRNTKISGNQFYRASQQDRSTAALRFISQGDGTIGHGNTISENIFYENYGQALKIDSNTATNTKITKNYFAGTGKGMTGASRIYDAIVVNDLDDATISDNIIDGKEQGHYVTVSTTAGSTTASLVSEVGGTLATGMGISGKGIPRNTTVSVSGSTITLSQAAVLTVSNQIMKAGNIVTRYGILATQTTNSNIEGNVTENCVSNTAFFSGNRGATIKGNIVPITYTTTATVNPDEDQVYVTAASPWTLTLQSAVLFRDKEITIIKTDNNANLITVNGGGVNINGSATYTGLNAQYKYLRVRSNGTQWYITGNN